MNACRVMAANLMRGLVVGGLVPHAGRPSVPALPSRASGFACGRAVTSCPSAPSTKRCRLQIVRAIAAPPKPPSSVNGSVPADFKAWENIESSVKKRDDIKTIMLLGAGPIVIGQVPAP